MTDPATIPSPRRRRWSRILLAVVIVVLAALGGGWLWLWSIRSAGLELNRKVLAEQEAAGLGTTTAALYAAAPAIDLAVQAGYKAWDAQLRANHDQPWMRTLRDAMAERGGSAPAKPALAVETALDQAKAGLDGLAALLATGHLQLSAFGWLKAEIPDPEHAAWQRFASCTTPSLVSLRAAADGFACRALAAADPVPALADLDRLVAATDRPACLIDAMIACTLRRTRDQCYLALEREGRLPAAARERWNAAPLDDLRLVADGFRGERLMWHIPLNRALVEGSLGSVADGAASELGEPSSGIMFGIANWTHGPGDMAVVLGWLAATEQACRAGRAPLWSGQAPEAHTVFGHGTILSIAVPSLGESAVAAMQAMNLRRLKLLASRLLGAWRERHALPADEAAFQDVAGAPALAAGPARCRLRYERLTPTRFRLTVDPAVAPEGWPADVILSRLAGISALGKPLAKRPAPLLETQGTVEVELPER